MKKVLLAFDGSKFSEGAFSFARQLNAKAPILLAGVFLPHISYANLWSYSSAPNGAVYAPVMEGDGEEQLQENRNRFEELCVEHGIEYRIHSDHYDFTLEELKRESRFADLLIISSEQFFEYLPRKDARYYMRQALHDSECPVVVVPEAFEFPQTNILAYNGSSDSVYAIKQFAYLFPELTGNKTVFVYCGENDQQVPEEENIAELADLHFQQSGLTRLDLDPRKYFASWVAENKKSILVSGSFGRSGFSEMFRRSFVAEAISKHRIPVFIAHR